MTITSAYEDTGIVVMMKIIRVQKMENGRWRIEDMSLSGDILTMVMILYYNINTIY